MPAVWIAAITVAIVASIETLLSVMRDAQLEGNDSALTALGVQLAERLGVSEAGGDAHGLWLRFEVQGASQRMRYLWPGRFVMGSPESEAGRPSDEGAQHEVTIKPFAIGKYEVTVGEYRRFVEATDRPQEGGIYVWTGSVWTRDEAKSWQDPGFAQTDRHPVVGCLT